MILTVASIFAASAVCSQAAAIYSITFDNGNSPATDGTQFDTSLVTTTVAPGFSGDDAATILANQTYRADAGDSGVGNTSPRIINTGLDGSSVEELLLQGGSETEYLQFGLSATVPGTLILNSLSFNALRGTTSDQTRGYSISVSLDGGAYNFLAANNVDNNRNDGPELEEIDLTGAQFQGINSADFRLFNTVSTVEIGNVVVDGVPEPSSTALLGLSGMALLLRRTRC